MALEGARAGDWTGEETRIAVDGEAVRCAAVDSGILRNGCSCGRRMEKNREQEEGKIRAE